MSVARSTIVSGPCACCLAKVERVISLLGFDKTGRFEPIVASVAGANTFSLLRFFKIWKDESRRRVLMGKLREGEGGLRLLELLKLLNGLLV